MEERKQKEIEHYDKEAEKVLDMKMKESGSSINLNPFFLSSYDFLRSFLNKEGRDKKILDYGCGMGVHLDWLAEIGSKVVGIDLSQESLRLAEKRIEKQGLKGKVELLAMDCEKMDFEDASFDIVFDGGTFSSLDIEKALLEIRRVLKPNGFLIGIETLGHNPLLNLKRKLNQLRGKRTKWAAEHILTIKDLKKMERIFAKIDIRFFHLISWFSFPFLRFKIGRIFLQLLEMIDNLILFLFPFLSRYCFKVVFIFKKNP